MTKIGLCVVGCGNFAKIFSESIQPLLPNVKLYFASRNLAKATEYCNLFNGSGAFGSYIEASRSNDIQAMYICTPHYLHLEHVNIAANAGKHVLVEKPISSNLNDATRIINSCERNNVKLMIAENYRFLPETRSCKELIDHGELGQIRVIQIQEDSSHQAVGWRTRFSQNGGGILIDAGIHKIHFLRYLLGTPDLIYAVIPSEHHVTHQVENGITLVASWVTGENAIIHHSWIPSEMSAKHWVSVTGSQGKIYFEVGKSKLELYQDDQHHRIKMTGSSNGILEMTIEFINSIIDNRSPEVSGKEGFLDLEIVDRAYRSVNDNQLLLSLASGDRFK